MLVHAYVALLANCLTHSCFHESDHSPVFWKCDESASDSFSVVLPSLRQHPVFVMTRTPSDVPDVIRFALTSDVR